MRIKNIKIENFRCFKSYEISFGEKTTVLIGKNGTGKTNIITALKKGMSFMFANTKEYKNYINLSNNCNVRAFSFWDARFDDMERIYNFPIKISYDAVFNNEILNWTFLKKKNGGSLHPTFYRDALNKVLNTLSVDKSAELPVLAFFSDAYPHVISNVGEKAANIVKHDVLSRDFGYYGWDDDSNCVELWQRRYIKVANILNDGNIDINEIENELQYINSQIRDIPDRNGFHSLLRAKEKSLRNRLDAYVSSKTNSYDAEKELSFINKYIELFTEPVRDDLNAINKEFQVRRVTVNRPDRRSFSIEFKFIDFKSMFFETLPQGYKRLLSIVFDIAYRSYILNRDKEPKGIVFIDEIELHLHPTLQQEVLQRFQKTFPQIQFIITTHSPLVISNLKADGVENRIIKLENNANEYFNTEVENIYGLDYSTNLAEIMEVAPRSSTIDKYINAYLFLYGKNKIEDAQKMLNNLKQYIGGEIPNLLQKEINEKKESYK